MAVAPGVIIPPICVDDAVTQTHTNISSSEWRSNALNTPHRDDDDAGFVNYNLTGCLWKSDALSCLSHTHLHLVGLVAACIGLLPLSLFVNSHFQFINLIKETLRHNQE